MRDIRGFCRKLEADLEHTGTWFSGPPRWLRRQAVELIDEAATRNWAHLSLADHLPTAQHLGAEKFFRLIGVEIEKTEESSIRQIAAIMWE